MELSDHEVLSQLAPGEPGDDLLLTTLAALRSAGHPVAVLEVNGIGPDTAAAVIEIGGRTMRLTAQPW